jgi:hypothetical protein
LHLPLSLPVPCPLCPPNWSSPFHNTQVSRVFPPAFLCLPSPHAWFCSWTVPSPQKNLLRHAKQPARAKRSGLLTPVVAHSPARASDTHS